MKNMNGVTLVALVITVIVLLILAGIAYSNLLGDNGLLKRASESGKVSREAEKKEENALNHYTEKVDEWSGRGTGIESWSAPRDLEFRQKSKQSKVIRWNDSSSV